MKTTGFSRVSKDSIIGELEKELKNRPAFFVAQHGKLSATSIDQLRNRLRATNTRYFVVKNSLGKKAFERAKLTQFSDSLSGSCGIAFSSGDIVASSKALMDFAKENETFKVQNAYFNGEVVGLDKVKVLASLPSKEVLLARVVGGMQSPIRGFVSVLAGTVRQVVTVIDAIAKKKGMGQ